MLRRMHRRVLFLVVGVKNRFFHVDITQDNVNYFAIWPKSRTFAANSH
jgi:hypothetical protein